MQQPACIKTTKHFNPIPKSAESNFACQVKRVIPINLGHVAKLVHQAFIK
jgi:hypothetical protein